MIEKVLDEMSKNGECLLLLKANKGYSAVKITQNLYVQPFLSEDPCLLMQEHYNGATVNEAIIKLKEGGDE